MSDYDSYTLIYHRNDVWEMLSSVESIAAALMDDYEILRDYADFATSYIEAAILQLGMITSEVSPSTERQIALSMSYLRVALDSLRRPE